MKTFTQLKMKTWKNRLCQSLYRCRQSDTNIEAKLGHTAGRIQDPVSVVFHVRVESFAPTREPDALLQLIFDKFDLVEPYKSMKCLQTIPDKFRNINRPKIAHYRRKKERSLTPNIFKVFMLSKRTKRSFNGSSDGFSCLALNEFFGYVPRHPSIILSSMDTRLSINYLQISIKYQTKVTQNIVTIRTTIV